MKPKNLIVADAKCLKAIAAGNRQEFERCWEASCELLQLAATRFTKDEELGELVIQHLHTELWEEREKLAGVTNLLTYTVRKLYVLTLKTLAAARKLDAEIEERRVLEGKATGIDAGELIRQRIKAAGDKLTPLHREVVELCWRDGYTFEELGEIKGMTPGLVERYYDQAVKIIISQPGTPE